MHLASQEGYLEVVKALKEMGGDPNAKDNVREGGGVIGWGIYYVYIKTNYNYRFIHCIMVQRVPI